MKFCFLDFLKVIKVRRHVPQKYKIFPKNLSLKPRYLKKFPLKKLGYLTRHSDNITQGRISYIFLMGCLLKACITMFGYFLQTM